MNYEIIAIILTSITGPSVAILTVYLEYRKDKKEKLQDRKDMWLDAHFSDVADQLIYLYYLEEPPAGAYTVQTNLKEFIYKRKNVEDVAYWFVAKDNFSTRLVHIKNFQYFLDHSKDSFTIIDINKIRNIYTYSFNHIKTGYHNISKDIMDLWDAELEYKKYVEANITVIFDLIKETIAVQFPILKPKLDYGEPSSYNIKKIFDELVRNAEGEKVYISFKEENKNGIFFGDDASAFVHMEKNEAEKFISEVWIKLKNDSQEDLKKIMDYNKKILIKESKFKESLLDIIALYVSGHIIEGYCDICDKIYHEKDITKLRPKI